MSGANGNGKAGRPRKEVDPKLVVQIARRFCTTSEIAAILGVDETLIRRNFAEEVAKGREQAKGWVRKKQYEAARNGNVAMLIWLGKQYLGQADKAEVKTGFEELYSKSPVEIANELRRRSRSEVRAGLNGSKNGSGHGGNGNGKSA